MLYLYKNWNICKKGSFNQSYNDSYSKEKDCEREFGVLAGSYDESFDESFESVQRVVDKSILLVPKSVQDNAMLTFSIHNVAENIHYFFYMKDIRDMRGYYAIKMYNYRDIPSGEYNYRLTGSGGALLSEGILIIVGDEPEVKEYDEQIEYNEYGNN